MGMLKSITSVCSMTLTVSLDEGMMVITVNSNPKNKWPVLCQILGFLCCSPVSSASQGMKGKLKEIYTALGIVQIIVGVSNIVVGTVFLSLGFYYSLDLMFQGPFWLGSAFLLAGIVCILGTNFPHSCLLIITMILNVFSAALAFIAVMLYSLNLPTLNYYSQYDYSESPSPIEKQKVETYLYYKHLGEMIFRGLDIMMILLSVFQLCVTISFCVWTGKVLCKKDEDAKSVEDPELHKPLIEDATAGPGC